MERESRPTQEPLDPAEPRAGRPSGGWIALYICGVLATLAAGVAILFFMFDQETQQRPKALPPEVTPATGPPGGADSRAVTERQTTLGRAGAPVREASGLAESRRRPGTFYTHDDSGGDPSVFVLASDGTIIATQPLAGVENRDWEDIALGPGPRGGRIYVAETGDNLARHDSVFIYRIPEPEQRELEGAEPGSTLAGVEPEVLELTYPDGARDAEALIVDPANGDIILVTKREDRSRIYRASNPRFDTGRPVTLEFIGDLPFNDVVAGDACPNGKTVLLKTYLEVRAFTAGSGGVTRALTGPSSPRLYRLDPRYPQDEALAASPDCTGYSVLPEGVEPPLVRYAPERR